MGNILKIDLKEVLHTIIYLLVVAICFVLFFQFTQQSVSNSLTRNIANAGTNAQINF
jgi:hypothetical protein